MYCVNKYVEVWEPETQYSYKVQFEYTLFECENEWQKIEKAPIPLPRAFKNFPDVRTRNKQKNPYSQVPIKQVGPNKRVGWVFWVNSILTNMPK